MTQNPPLVFDPATPRQQVQRQLSDLLATAGSQAAMTEARMLLCAALHIDHADLLREGERPIGAHAERLADLIARRLKHEPVSRILGRREFWGLDFSVSPAVLDPRPDTETLVEAVLAAIGSRRDERLRVLDLGTGSGALLCALLANFPGGFGLGVDVSEAACKIAAKNLAALGFAQRGQVVCGDWAEALRGSFDIIVSNPPYIAHAEIATLDPNVRDYDPHLALDGGDDGYAAYRALASVLPGLLAQDGVAVLELGIGQGPCVGKLLQAAGLVVMTTRRDLAGIERAIVAKMRPQDECRPSLSPFFGER
ncbi:MAG: peptide chain release factor N(5)-glutamine methyltransferase [Beijerinckiaceae bacterium]|nr:MAG: peptide chain release factor N(5)-glutamine methyltransferase [Beijerinckiaceae bacterium]